MVIINIFLARQAIYDRSQNIIAYEMLFRNSNINQFDLISNEFNEDDATLKLISNCSTIGFRELTSDKKAFINFTEGILLNDIPTILPKDVVVIEILENVNPIPEIIESIKQLKQKGYVLALDDVVYSTRYKEFGDLIDIYKIDFIDTNKFERKLLLDKIRKVNPRAKFLAEKIEDEETYKEAIKNSFTYFQGYYFSRPVMISGKDIPIREACCFNIMLELMKDEFDIDVLEKMIELDVAMSYKLMKFLNSAKFSFKQRISSLRQAIVIMGKNELRKWISVIAVSNIISDDNEEFISQTLIRARFCELIAQNIKEEKNKAFIVGLFSSIDTYLDMDMGDVLRDLPLDVDIKDALTGEKNTLNDILVLVKAYENMDFEEVGRLLEELKLDSIILPELFIDSIEWSNKIV